jgi:putative superfamily III holin-X
VNDVDEHALLALVRNVVDDFGALFAGHVRLARAELAVDARALGRRVGLVAIAAALLLVGYGLACVAAALALARLMAPPLAFLAVAGVHLVGAGVGLGVLIRRAEATAPLDESLAELHRTVTTLSKGTSAERSLAERPRNGGAEGLERHGRA